MLKFNIENKVQAHFQLVVRKKDSGDIVKESSWFPNIVLNQGLERLGYGGVMNYCRVGVGSSAPLATQTQLDQQVASTSTTEGSDSYGVNPSRGYSYIRRTYRFNSGSAAGNITEVGLGWGASGPESLFNRAMIRDTSGNITTVTVLSDEVLDVLVELRSYVSLTPKSAVATISSVQYDLVIQPFIESSSGIFNSSYYCSGAQGYSGSITGVSSRPPGSLDSFGVTNKNYIGASLKKQFEIYWGLNQGNAAPLKTVVCSTPYCSYQVELNPPIPKTSETVLKLSFEVSWGRYE